MNLFQGIYSAFVLLSVLCKAKSSQQPCLFVSNTTHILSVQVDLTSSSPVLQNLNRVVAVDVHVSRNLIFWSDVNDKTIKRANTDGSNVKVIVNYFIGVCDGLAVEWTSDLIYWSDTTLNNIEVAHLDGSNRRTLLSDNLDEPRGVAVDPLSRLIFWTDWGAQPKIERAHLNGENRRPIVTSSLGWPNDITLDHRYYRIYWVDAQTDAIESTDYSGNHRTPHVRYTGIHPFGVDILNSWLFWTDWNTVSGLHKMDKSTGALLSNFNVQGRRMGLAVFDSSRQPSSISSCQQNNGGCSHLCLLKPSGHDCACPTGYGIGSDGKTCNKDINRFITFTDADLKTTNIISLDVNYKTWKILYHHSNNSRPIAIDYDPVEKRIYWTDVTLKYIASAFINATSARKIYHQGIQIPDGIAVDYLGRNLYWTDAGTNKIEVGRLDGSARKILIDQNLDEPRAIALYAEIGTMYWTDWGSAPKIETSFMDGTSRKVLFDTGLVWPNGLTIDKVHSKLYWADAGLDKIEESDLSGANRIILTSHSGIHPFGLTLYDGDLYWTDWTNKSVYTLNIVSGKKARVASGLAKPMDIHAYNETSSAQGNNSCSESNGGCSELCLPTPAGRTCACANGTNVRSDDPTKCGQVIAVNCSSPRLNPNTVLLTHGCGRHIGAVCSFACRNGYLLAGGSASITCQQNGTWSGDVPICSDSQNPVFVSCPDNILTYAEKGTTLSNVTWVAPNATDNSGEAPNITLVVGYVPPVRLTQGIHNVSYRATDSANKIAYCNFTVTVKVISCTSPYPGGVLGVSGCHNYYGGTCNFTCPNGYRLVGMRSLTCLATNGKPPGVWNGVVPTCQAITCPVLQVPPNAIKIGCNGIVSERYGTVCRFQCSHGYKPSGATARTCQHNGTWTGNALSCSAITCPALPIPANAIKTGCSGIVSEMYGTVCQFQCIHGYKPSAVISRSCQHNGTWTGNDLSCSNVTCSPLTKPINGLVAPATCLQYSHYSSVCVFSCTNGFRIRGTTSRTCTSNNVWTGQNDTTCEDVTPPTFLVPCPQDTIYNLDRCSDDITVNWTKPVFRDNSGVVRIAGPSHDPPFTLYPGVYTINYTAIDPTGNTRRCSFRIQVNKHVCRHLTNPTNGFITFLTCSNSYGSVATFSCRIGYTMSGSKLRSCLLNGQWSGVDTTCTRVTCPALKPLNFGTIEPRNCVTGIPVVSGTWCLFKCNLTDGYRNVGPDRATCRENGTWSADTSKIFCKDFVPPSLRCPHDATNLATDPGKDVSTYTWVVPEPTDNSGDKPSLTVKPDGLSPPHQFPVGISTVEYTAEDSSGLQTRCVFTVTVRDAEAPKIVYCPRDLQLTSSKRSTPVYFPQAKFEDNVGVTRVISDRYNGSELAYGEHNVTYTAYDGAGNTATCTLKITLASITCKKPKDPQHGALSCLTLPGGTYCRVHCYEGYVNPLSNNEIQVCTHTGQWIQTTAIPNCRAPNVATVTLEGNLHYVTTNCTSRKEEIRKTFMERLLQNILGGIHCRSFPNKCKLQNVEVTCKRARKRRSVDDSERVDISFEMQLPFVKNSSADVNNTIAKFTSSVMETINKSLSKLEVDGQVVTLDNSLPSTLRFVSLTCAPGEVLKGAVCVACPPGYFLSSSSIKSCSPCPANHYQELEGQTSCKKCPSGTSSAKGQSKSCVKDHNTGSLPTTTVISVVVGIVAVILLVVVIVWILKRRQCICTGQSKNPGDDRDRIVYGPRRSTNEPKQFHGPYYISNPAFDDGSNDHIYAEIPDRQVIPPQKLYVNVGESVYENHGVNVGESVYENHGIGETSQA